MLTNFFSLSNKKVMGKWWGSWWGSWWGKFTKEKIFFIVTVEVISW